MLEFPLRFENPFFGVFGIILGGIFAVLFYLSFKKLRTAEKSLELVKWQTVRRMINIVNIGAKMGLIFALSFLLAVPYFLISVDVPIEKLSVEQLNQSAVTVMILMDVSYSMNYSDLKPSRFQVTKQMTDLLVDSMSPADSIGFLSFAARIYDEILPALNKSLVKSTIDNQTIHPSTAIGTALATALGVLEPYQGGKAIVLFTDGKNNVGVMNLTTVAEDAASIKVPIFTIFAGAYGMGEADPIVLQEISNISGGKFYDIKSEEIKALVTEVGTISKEVKVGALKSAFDKLTFELKDYHTPLLFFAALIAISLFLTWFTGV
jgi:Mg-chelatase subunit ChlD